MKPKVFLSYSWSSEGHIQFILNCAERLISDGVDVVLDKYELKEGHDKYQFMERMVTDPHVTHVLVFSDKIYAEKADARRAGVGTESQIISREVYEKIDQSKFIPLVCEFTQDHAPYLPAFLQSRIWIDFSSPEAINSNWEQLIRLLFGKPQYVKPALGTPPIYITSDVITPSTPAKFKLDAFREALLQEKKGISHFRSDLLESCILFVDALRVRNHPDLNNLASTIVQDYRTMIPIRDHIVDWVLLESSIAPSEQFTEALLGFLERLREVRSRPKELSTYNEVWFEAHKLFTYETFLYIIASLIKTADYNSLHEILWALYIVPETEAYGSKSTCRYDDFYAYSEVINSVLATKGHKLYSPAAELLKRNAQRTDIPFDDVIQADLLALLIALIDSNINWYPQTLLYSNRSQPFPLFLKATRHRYFKNLAKITGIESAGKLRELVQEGHKRLNTSNWHQFTFSNSFAVALNLNNLDTAP